MVVDGKDTKSYDELRGHALFSNDGQHLAYIGS